MEYADGMSQSNSSAENAEFWNDICGSNAANGLGLTDRTLNSLRVFDSWYFGFYPYLMPFINKALSQSQSVLEVGLGYGSVGQTLIEDGYTYCGLDIANEPVQLMRFRISESEQVGKAELGDVLNCPFPDSTFDAAIAIGSLHHTGNFDLAINELKRVIIPGGTIIGMVYSYFSLRNWLRFPVKTFRLALKNVKDPVRLNADEKLRWLSDYNSTGQAAPHTEYFSKRTLKRALSSAGDVTIRRRNLDAFPLPFGLGERFRLLLLKTPLQNLFGLDLYFVLNITEL
jgi:SAM-dependent methyltransferase